MNLRIPPRREIEANGLALAKRLIEESANEDVVGAIVRAFAAGQAIVFNQARGRPTCRICGCTDYLACPGPCWWADEDVCSSCFSATIIEPAKEA